MIEYQDIKARKILFILGGLAMGGVETYIVRLARALAQRGSQIDLMILSNKYDPKLVAKVSKYANVIFIENAPNFSASSWINAFLPARWRVEEAHYDIVHVVDLLMFGFVFFNKDVIKFDALSIGIYHSLELSWWREKNVYFRRKLIELYERNVKLTLFPGESTARLAAGFTNVHIRNLDMLPLGIDLLKYKSCKPSISSKKIVSVGRLVDFKAYNRHVISQLSKIRNLGDFEYYIYGTGPEKSSLIKLAKNSGVSNYVHFMGHLDYDDLPDALNGVFCFVGSGTTIIEASAAGIPSFVGIESIQSPHTCGFFADVIGYSYNESSATDVRMTFYEALKSLRQLNEHDFVEVSDKHRKKASEFDLNFTALTFMSMSSKKPDFEFSFNRWLALISFLFSVARFGPRALKNRFDPTPKTRAAEV